MENTTNRRIVALVGPSGAGKTSVVHRLLEGKFYGKTPITLGIDTYKDSDSTSPVIFLDFVSQRRIFEIIWNTSSCAFLCKFIVVTPLEKLHVVDYYLENLGLDNTAVIINKSMEQLESQIHQPIIERCRRAGVVYIQTDCSTGEGIPRLREYINICLNSTQTKQCN